MAVVAGIRPETLAHTMCPGHPRLSDPIVRMRIAIARQAGLKDWQIAAALGTNDTRVSETWHPNPDVNGRRRSDVKFLIRLPVIEACMCALATGSVTMYRRGKIKGGVDRKHVFFNPEARVVSVDRFRPPFNLMAGLWFGNLATQSVIEGVADGLKAQAEYVTRAEHDALVSKVADLEAKTSRVADLEAQHMALVANVAAFQDIIDRLVEKGALTHDFTKHLGATFRTWANMTQPPVGLDA